jgi:hypothetical protein
VRLKQSGIRRRGRHDETVLTAAIFRFAQQSAAMAVVG